jgi:hypothetical protein
MRLSVGACSTRPRRAGAPQKLLRVLLDTFVHSCCHHAMQLRSATQHRELARAALLWYKKSPAGSHAYHRNLNLDFDAAWIR